MEVTREVLGNAADEQGAHEQGVDFESVNRSMVPEAVEEPLEVDVSYRQGEGLTLVPKGESPEFMKSLAKIKEGPLDILTAQLFEEPDEVLVTKRVVNGVEVLASDRRTAQISKRESREELVYYGISSDVDEAMFGDRILIRKDVMESVYCCKTCKGLGYDEAAVCQSCMGTQVERGTEGTSVPCRTCKCLGYGKERAWSSGRNQCRQCRGTGWRGGIVIPEQSQAKPITGVVVSIGPECRMLKLGDRVIHSKYAGHTQENGQGEEFTMMHEKEVLGILKARRC